MKVYCVGSHSTGKTTLARAIASAYKLPLITEVARGVLAAMEVRLDSLRVDMPLVIEYQQRVFRAQVAAEAAHPDGFVSDRAFDNLAYAAEHADIRVIPGIAEYMRSITQTGAHVFFVRPHKEMITDDGVRSGLDWEAVVRIDGMIKLLLELHGVRYMPIAMASMQERMHVVNYVLGSKRKRRAIHE